MSVTGNGCAACNYTGRVPWASEPGMEGAVGDKPCDRCGGFSQFAATFPRWVAGGPADTPGLSPVLLREVARNLFVGSALSWAHLPVSVGSVVVVQCSEHCPPVPGALGVLRVPFDDRALIPSSVFSRVIDVARGRRPMLVHCYAGLSRSAAVAYAILRMVDGLTHDEASARVAHATEHHDRTDRWPHHVTLASAKAWCDAQNRPPPAPRVAPETDWRPLPSCAEVLAHNARTGGDCFGPWLVVDDLDDEGSDVRVLWLSVAELHDEHNPDPRVEDGDGEPWNAEIAPNARVRPITRRGEALPWPEVPR